MEEPLKIYIDRLKQGAIEKIDRTVSSDFLDIDEPELKFEPEVLIHGEVYIASEELVCHLDIGATAVIPCSICNEPVALPIQVQGLYHVEELENIRAGIYDLSGIIRENLLLETPTFAECQGGDCPQRNTINKYLKNEKSPQRENSEEEGYHPFSDL